MQRIMSPPPGGATPLQCGASRSDTAQWSRASSLLSSQDACNRTVTTALPSFVGPSLSASFKPPQVGGGGFANCGSTSVTPGRTSISDSQSAQVRSPVAGVRLLPSMSSEGLIPLRTATVAGPKLQIKALVRSPSPTRGAHERERMAGHLSSAACLNHRSGSVAIETDSATNQTTWKATHVAASHAVSSLAQSSSTPSHPNLKPETKLVASEAKSSAAACSPTASAIVNFPRRPLQSQLDEFRSRTKLNPEQAAQISLRCSSSSEEHGTVDKNVAPNPHASADPRHVPEVASDTTLEFEKDPPVAVLYDETDGQKKQTFYGQFATARVTAEREERESVISDDRKPEETSSLPKALGSPRYSEISSAVESTTTPKSSAESFVTFNPFTCTKDGRDSLDMLESSVPDQQSYDELRKQIQWLKELFHESRRTPGPAELGRALDESQKQLREVEERRNQLQGSTSPEQSLSPESQRRSSLGSQEYGKARSSPGRVFRPPMPPQRVAKSTKSLERAPRVMGDAHASRGPSPQPDWQFPTSQHDGLTQGLKFQPSNRFAAGVQASDSTRALPTSTHASSMRQPSPLQRVLRNPSTKQLPIFRQHGAPNGEAHARSMQPPSQVGRSSSNQSKRSSQSSHHHGPPSEGALSCDVQQSVKSLEQSVKALELNNRLHDRLEKLLVEIEKSEQSQSVISVIHEIRDKQREMIA